MRHIDRAHVNLFCICAERGADGTRKHGNVQSRTFAWDGGRVNIVRPCTNHVKNYATSPVFEEVEVERPH